MLNVFKKMNKIEKTIFVVWMIILTFVLTCTNLTDVIRDRIENVLYPEKGLVHYYVFDEEDVHWTGEELILPAEFKIDSCRLWPAGEPLVGGKYWDWSTEANQWIGCF